jgi:hypothetical protein
MKARLKQPATRTAPGRDGPTPPAAHPVTREA